MTANVEAESRRIQRNTDSRGLTRLTDLLILAGTVGLLTAGTLALQWRNPAYVEQLDFLIDLISIRALGTFTFLFAFGAFLISLTGAFSHNQMLRAVHRVGRVLLWAGGDGVLLFTAALVGVLGAAIPFGLLSSMDMETVTELVGRLIFFSVIASVMPPTLERISSGPIYQRLVFTILLLCILVLISTEYLRLAPSPSSI